MSFTNIRSTAHLSSEENLTSVVSVPSRPTQLDIVESGHNEIVITPDRNQEKNLRNVSMAPESSNKEGGVVFVERGWKW